MDIGAKVFIRIMCKLMFKVIKAHGYPTHFGSSPGVGCQDGQFVIKTALHARHKHNLGTYVDFVDLVKAFDTVSHAMLIIILEWYGVPPKLRPAIERMYKYLKIVLKIGKAKAEMNQTVGVRQGNCMAPVLFLFVIMAFAETLRIEWKDMGQNMLLLLTRTKLPRESGSLKGHLTKTFSEGHLLELFNVLYGDDGAFTFEDQKQLTLGAQLIFDHFKIFGLEMHIGRGEKASKTECVFFPPPGFFKNKHILPASENGSLDELV